MKSLKDIGVDPKKFEFKSAKSTSKYPWDEILNGRINVIVQGEDYDLPTEAMPPKIKTAARRRYKTVKVSTRSHTGDKLDNMLIVQSFDMDNDQRIAEDLKRAEEKASRAAAKDAEAAAADDDVVNEAAA